MKFTDNLKVHFRDFEYNFRSSFRSSFYTNFKQFLYLHRNIVDSKTHLFKCIILTSYEKSSASDNTERHYVTARGRNANYKSQRKEASV